jgi:hypothetical protein
MLGGAIVSAVIVVCFVWFAIVAVIGIAAIVLAHQIHLPAWGHRIRARCAAATDGSIASIGRSATALIVLLAGWSVVILVGWVLGRIAHSIQGSVDWPAFRWWQRNYLDGPWHHQWRRLTNIGSTLVTQIAAIVGAALMAVLYAGRRFWWAPSVTLLLGYLAEKFGQIDLQLVVHRGHPPTTHGTWPSGGMGRLLDIYGLIIYFVIMRYWPNKPRVWASGAALLAVLASIQAYARLNNLEHWTTDVAGGLPFGLMLLAMMILGYKALTRETTDERADSEPAGKAAADVAV